MLKSVLFTITLICVASSAHAALTPLYVTNPADSGAGSLRQAIIDGNNLPSGQYPKIYMQLGSNQTIYLNSSLPQITKKTFMLLGDPDAPVRIDGQSSYSLLHQATAVPSLIQVSNVELANGYAEPGGAACLYIGAETGFFDISNVKFLNCIKESPGSSAYGAAISADGGYLTITDSVFNNNLSKGKWAASAAIHFVCGPTTTNRLWIKDSDFLVNRSQSNGGYTKGGAISVQNAELIVEDSFFFGNQVEDLASGSVNYGSGAIDATEANVSVRRSTFRSNLGDWGGAISVTYGLNGTDGATFVNNTFVNNVAESVGGAILTQGVDVVLRNNSFYRNDAEVAGNNFMGTDPADDFPSYSVWNNLFNNQFAGSSCHVASINAVSSGYNIIPDSGCGLNSDGTSLVVADANLQGYLSHFRAFVAPLRFFADSEALDAGNPIAPDDANATACPELDGQGNPRVVDGNADGTARCDIGAFEWQHEASLFADDFENRL